MELHLEAEIAENVEHGMPPEQARRAAHLKFGSARRVREQVWEGNSMAWMETVLRDMRYVVRRLFKQPVFVLAVVVSLGLGVAANVTIFSMVNRVMLKPAPVGHPSTLLTVRTWPKGEDCCNNFSLPVYEDVRDQAKSFSGVAAYQDLIPASIGGVGEPEHVYGQTVTANFFDVAEMPMVAGRGFHADEERAPAIVLGYGLWKRKFAGDSAVIGRTVQLSGHPYSVVGVAPAAFHGIDGVLYAEFWVPMGNVDQLEPGHANFVGRDYHWINVMGRLKPGVTQAMAQSELNTIAQRLEVAYPKTDKDNRFEMDAAGTMPPRALRQVGVFLAMLLVVATLVLCIACANVGNLLLARAADHQREMAVRLALGATRGVLLRQMLTESVLLAIGGGAAGVALSLWAMWALGAFKLPVPLPLDLSLHADWRVLLYAFALSVGAGLLCGFVPAWRASRPLLANGLKGESALARPGRRFSLRNVLVVTQIALSAVLLCATVLFLRSLGSASRIDVGFRTRGMLMMSLDPMEHGYDKARAYQFLDQLRARVGQMPGVSSAAVVDFAPLSMDGTNDGVSAKGVPKLHDKDPVADFYMVSPGYFDTMGIARLAGRDFAEESLTGQKVAVINQALAQSLFGRMNPVGQTVSSDNGTFEVVGVVANAKSRYIGTENAPVLYRSLQQGLGGSRSDSGYTLLVHTTGDSASVADAVRQQIHSMDPTLAVFNATTVEGTLHDALFLPRLSGTLFGVFGIAGLLLAGVGLYGVMSYSVSRRTREIGIRLALGATRSGLQGLIVKQGMWLAGIAVVIGVPLALMVARVARSFLYGIEPYDAVTFATVPVFLGLVAMLACWVPARRAAKVEPMVALRYE